MSTRPAPTLEGTTLTWTGALEAGKSVVLTYQVKINDGVVGGVLINNKVTGTAKPPTGPEITPPPVTTEHPVQVPGFTVAKAADPGVGYQCCCWSDDHVHGGLGANTGNTTLDPVVLTDDLSKVLDNAALVDGSLKATVDGVDGAAPTLSGTTLTWTGVLEAGKSVVLTYQVKINAGVAGGTLINNKVTGTAKPPTGPEITPPPVTTEHPVDGTPAIEVLKSSVPSTTNRVVGGQEITYTLTFKNVGTADGEISFYDDLTDVLDDAVMTKNPATTSTLVVSGVVDNVFTVTGKLAKGESATVTYTVKVNPEIGTLSGPGFTPGVLNNYLVVGGENPPVDCVPGDALCTEHPVDPPETTTTVPPTTTTTPPVTTEPCVPPTTTTRMVPTTTVATTTASATTAGDADVAGTEESTTTEETTTEETTTEEVVRGGDCGSVWRDDNDAADDNAAGHDSSADHDGSEHDGAGYTDDHHSPDRRCASDRRTADGSGSAGSEHGSGTAEAADSKPGSAGSAEAADVCSSGWNDQLGWWRW